MESKENTYIRFDWAMKRLLRNKANFDVLEGFLSTLLREPIKIHHLLESESNMETAYDRQNRVDLLAEDSKEQLIIIEVQNNNEFAYFQRMLFGTSKLLTEYINRGQGYDKVRKIYSINIVYFALGKGRDVVYHGKTEFRGLRYGDVLELSPFQRQKFNVSAVSDLYPEYYILNVNNFDDVARTPLDEWISYLKHGVVADDASAQGLDKVRERMKVDTMSAAEKESYYRHLDDIVILQSNVFTEREEGRFEGRAEGRAEGIVEGRAEGRAEGMAEGMEKGRAEGEANRSKVIAMNMKKAGIPTADIQTFTGLSAAEINEL